MNSGLQIGNIPASRLNFFRLPDVTFSGLEIAFIPARRWDAFIVGLGATGLPAGAFLPALPRGEEAVPPQKRDRVRAQGVPVRRARLPARECVIFRLKDIGKSGTKIAFIPLAGCPIFRARD